MKRRIVFIVLILVIISSLSVGCDNSLQTDLSSTYLNTSDDSDLISTQINDLNVITTDTTFSEETTETVTEPIPTDIIMGEKIVLPFAEIVFTEWGIENDLHMRVQISSFEYSSFGPEAVAGKKYFVVRGVVKNTTHEYIDGFYYLDKLDLDGYKYDGAGSEIWDSSGSTTWLDPLVEYNFYLYVIIPDEIASNYTTGKYRLGFTESFKNDVYDYLSGGSISDSISNCPYYYSINL